MKKVTMILAAVAMFAVVSCGSKKTEEVVATDSVAVEADTTAVGEVDSSATEAAVL
jgi:uncharacterized protein YcfL